VVTASGIVVDQEGTHSMPRWPLGKVTGMAEVCAGHVALGPGAVVALVDPLGGLVDPLGGLPDGVGAVIEVR
jgi:hypothetical protein